MIVKSEKGIHGRGLTSFFTTFGFLILAFTGLILYLVPAGRVADWVHWSLFGMSKEQWTQIHTLGSLMFLTAGGFHIYYNWKPLMKYLSNKIEGGINLKKEFYISLLGSIFLIVAAAKELPPFHYVFEFSDYLKSSWIISEEYDPPMGHAELMSLSVFTQKQGIDLTKAIQELKDYDIIVKTPKNSLGKIAKENDTSPMKLYHVIKKFEKKIEIKSNEKYTAEQVGEMLEGRGVGRKNIQWLIKSYKLDSQKVSRRLKSSNITYSEDESFRDIANRYEVSPMDIIKVVMVKQYRLND